MLFPNLEIKDFNVIIDRKKIFDQPLKNQKITLENIRKNATGHREDYTTDFLLDYAYFRDNN